MESRNIQARLVMNSNGTWTITEDHSLTKTQTTSVNQLFKTTGPDGKVMYFVGNQQNKDGVTAVDPDNPHEGKPPHSVNASGTSKNSQLTESQAKSLAKILSSVHIPTVKQSASASALAISSAPSSGKSQISTVKQSPTASTIVKSQMPTAPAKQSALAAQHTVCKDSIPLAIPSVVSESGPEQGDVKTVPSSSVYKLLPKILQRGPERKVPAPNPRQFHGSIIKQPQQSAVLTPREPSIIHLSSGKETKLTFDLAPSRTSLLKNANSRPSAVPVSSHSIHKTSTSPDKGVYLGTFKVPSSQKGIDPILSRFATTIAQYPNSSLQLQGNVGQRHIPTSQGTNPSLQLQENAGQRNSHTYLNTSNGQFVIVSPKPIATVKPEPAVPVYSGNQTPVTLVSSSYVPMMPTYYPVILNQTLPKHPTVVRNQFDGQKPHILTSTVQTEPQTSNEDKVVSCVLQSPKDQCLEKEVILPEVCAEVVVESHDSGNSDHCEVKLETPDEPPVPRIESVFSLTHTDDTDQSERPTEDTVGTDITDSSDFPPGGSVSPMPTVSLDNTVGRTDCVTPVEEEDVSRDTSPDLTGKRKRKKPKRFIIENDSTSPPLKCSAKKKPFLKPVVFDPCFVVLDPLHRSVMMKLKQKLTAKQSKASKKQTCTRLCHEMFLKKLCKKRSIPCNRYLDQQNDIQELEVKQMSEGKDLKLDFGQKNDTGMLQKSGARFNVIPHKQVTPVTVKNRQMSDHNPVLNVRPLPTMEDRQEFPVPKSVKTNNTISPTQDHFSSQTFKSDVTPTVDTFDKCELPSPQSPSSETESALSESYIASELEDTSPVKSSDKLQPEVLEEMPDAVETDDVLNEQDNTDITEGLPEPPKQSSPKHGPQSPSSFMDIDDYLFQTSGHEKTEEKFSSKEESDDDWGNTELEVDPDSEPEEETESPDSARCPVEIVLPQTVPEPELSPEPSSPEEHKPDTVTSHVLSERVQRLKAMLAEQSRQVDNLRRLRRRTQK